MEMTVDVDGVQGLEEAPGLKLIFNEIRQSVIMYIIQRRRFHLLLAKTVLNSKGVASFLLVFDFD